METKEAVNFKPFAEKIVIKPIMKIRNPLVNDINHEAAILFGNATIKFRLPLDRYGNLLDPFESQDERKWLEKELDLDLNHHKQKENQWHKLSLSLAKNPITLHLNDPKQYLQYVIARANANQIAKSADAQITKQHRYVITSVDEDIKTESKSADLKIKCYMALGKLKDSKADMLNFLRVYGKKVSPVSKEDFLLTELQKIIDEDTQGFLKTYEDKDSYEIKLLIADAVECGAVIKNGRQYALPGGDLLAATGMPATINNVIEYLTSPANQDILTTIETRIKKSKEK